MRVVPLQPAPAQTVYVTLGGQACRINVYTKRQGMFVDLYSSNAPVVTGVIAQWQNRIVRDAYFGFVGDLAFIDLLGKDDPTYDGLGSRYELAYLEPADLVGELPT
jgi:hypothetical protein